MTRPAGLSALLQTFGFWGEPEPRGDTLNFSSVAGWQQALATGRLSNLELLAGEDARYGHARKNVSRETDDPSPIILSGRAIYPAEWNASAAWTRTGTGSADDLVELPAPFRSGVEEATPGLAHMDTTPNTPSAYDTTAPVVLADAGWLARFYIYEPKSQKHPALTWIWDRYQIEVADGRAAAMRFSPAWTQTKANQIYALLQVKDLSGAQQTQLDELREEIYLDEQSLDLGKGEDWYGAPVALEVLPGVDCFYVVAGGKSTQVKLSLEPNEPLWNDSPLAVACQGGAYVWQVGYRAFNATGKLRLSHYLSQVGLATGDINPTINGFQPPGTSIALTTEASGEGDGRKYTSVLQLSTNNPRFSPLFTALRVDTPAGTRSGGRVGDTPTFDSSDTDDPTGHPIKDVSPSFEDAMRRMQYNVDIRDIDGKTFKNVGGERTIEQQVCKLVVGGQTLMTNCLVKSALPYNMRGATENQPRVQVANANSGVRVSLVDPWFVLDEMPMFQDFVGDGQRLGFYIRTILKGAGFSDAELLGINDGFGRVLPAAKTGEDWLIRPDSRTTYGDYLRDLVQKWGMGAILFWGSDGKWYLQMPSTVPVATFSRSRSTPGAHITYQGLDLPREIDDFFNDFIVEGKDRDGNVIVESFQIDVSIHWRLGPIPAKNFIGRRRTKIYSDDAIKTRADAIWVCRSLKANFGLPPIFSHFESDWISNIFPGQYAMHDGVLCRLKSITGGSAKRKRMNYLLQQAA